jgi:hypothetical protein
MTMTRSTLDGRRTVPPGTRGSGRTEAALAAAPRPDRRFKAHIEVPVRHWRLGPMDTESSGAGTSNRIVGGFEVPTRFTERYQRSVVTS